MVCYFNKICGINQAEDRVTWPDLLHRRTSALTSLREWSVVSAWLRIWAQPRNPCQPRNSASASTCTCSYATEYVFETRAHFHTDLHSPEWHKIFFGLHTFLRQLIGLQVAYDKIVLTASILYNNHTNFGLRSALFIHERYRVSSAEGKIGLHIHEYLL